MGGEVLIDIHKVARGATVVLGEVASVILAELGVGSGEGGHMVEVEGVLLHHELTGQSDLVLLGGATPHLLRVVLRVEGVEGLHLTLREG